LAKTAFAEVVVHTQLCVSVYP